jgi:ABC-2 type transport system permease protein
MRRSPMNVIDLMLKDLAQILRDRKSLMFLIVMPVVFTVAMGFVFGGYGAPADSRVPVAVIGDPTDAAYTAFADMAALSGVIRIVSPAASDDESLRIAVRDGKLAAAVRMPADYLRTSFEGSTPLLHTIVDVASTGGMTARGELVNLSMRLTAAAATARLTVSVLSEGGKPAGYDDFKTAFVRAAASWLEQPDSLVTTVSSALTEKERNAGGFAHTSPSMILQFSIAALISAAGIIVEERKSRTLERLMTTRISRPRILLGHYLAVFTQVFAQCALLVLFGAVVLRVQYFHAPVATLLVTICGSAFVAALGLLIGIASRSEEQAVAFSLIPMFLLAGLGGAWVPLEFAGHAFQTIARLTPGFWMVDAYKGIVQRGLGVQSVLTPSAILLGWALLFGLLAVLRFRRQTG